MKRFFIDKNQFNINNIVLSGVEHNHLKNVLRLKEGEHVIIVCGDGWDYECEINNINKTQTNLTLLSKQKNVYDPKSNVTFFQALTKSDNMNLIIQKLTELGVKTFVPFESAFITAKDKLGKSEKLQAVSNQSIKQCKRSTPMQVLNTLSFKQLLGTLTEFDIVIFANECERVYNLNKIKLKSTDKIAVVVGSEGGFSPDEISALMALPNLKSTTLGKRILRAETCAISLTAVVMFLLGEWSNE